MFPEHVRAAAQGRTDPRLLVLNQSISAWLGRRSDLPVDFQFQAITPANQLYGDRPRSALGIDPWPERVPNSVDNGP